MDFFTVSNLIITKRKILTNIRNKQLFIKLREGKNLFELKNNNNITGEKEIAIVDYASPNMAKELHVGHVRSIVLGECISRMLEDIGNFKVERISHVGDFGTPMGYIIAHCLENNSFIIPENDEDISSIPLPTPEELTKIYTAANQRAKVDADFKQKALKCTLLLQQGKDRTVMKIWDIICRASRKGFDQIYKWFDATPKERGESFYGYLLPGIIEDLEQRGFIRIVEGGAKAVAFSDNAKEQIIVQKKDGSYLYSTTDLAAIKHRIYEEKCKKIVYITDIAQRYHFDQIFNIAEKVGWLNRNEVDVTHIGFGVVKSEGGEKVRSREGRATPLTQLLEMAEKKAQEAMDQAKFESRVEDSLRIQKIAMSAVKYFDLSHSYESDYIFSFTNMLQFKGNTSSYQLYAYTRLISILEKAYSQVGHSSNWNLENYDESTWYEQPQERALALCIVRYYDSINFAYNRLCPNWLCDYLYELVSYFHVFYEKCPILTAPTQEKIISRLILCENTVKIISMCLHLLGINATRM